jgi:hypothetical protein
MLVQNAAVCQTEREQGVLLGSGEGTLAGERVTQEGGKGLVLCSIHLIRNGSRQLYLYSYIRALGRTSNQVFRNRKPGR